MSRTNPIIREDANWLIDHHPDVFKALAGTRLILTGAAGFLGSYFLDVLDVFNGAGPVVRMVRWSP